MRLGHHLRSRPPSWAWLSGGHWEARGLRREPPDCTPPDILRLSEDLPIVIEGADTAERIEAIMPKLD